MWSQWYLCVPGRELVRAFASWKPGFHHCFALLTPQQVKSAKDGSWWQVYGGGHLHPCLHSPEFLHHSSRKCEIITVIERCVAL